MLVPVCRYQLSPASYTPPPVASYSHPPSFLQTSTTLQPTLQNPNVVDTLAAIVATAAMMPRKASFTPLPTGPTPIATPQNRSFVPLPAAACADPVPTLDIFGNLCSFPARHPSYVPSPLDTFGGVLSAAHSYVAPPATNGTQKTSFIPLPGDPGGTVQNVSFVPMPAMGRPQVATTFTPTERFFAQDPYDRSSHFLAAAPLAQNVSFVPLPVTAMMDAHPVDLFTAALRASAASAAASAPGRKLEDDLQMMAVPSAPRSSLLAVSAGVSPLKQERYRQGAVNIQGLEKQVMLNVYYQRAVAYDSNGRAQRRIGGNELSWGNQLLKDMLGVYHVGIEVHGVEYAFGTYHGVGMQQLGGSKSGVVAHQPQMPGPQAVFKQAVACGTTTLSAGQVQEACENLGRKDFSKASYNRIHHNCVDFARALCVTMDAGELPLWCCRGAETAKLLGFGSPSPEGEYGTPGNSITTTAACQEGNGGSVNFMNGSGLGSVKVQQPHAGLFGGLASSGGFGGAGLAADAASSPSTTGAAASLAANDLFPGRHVSVFQSLGTWALGRILAIEPDWSYRVQYDHTGATEGYVRASRIVPLPQVPREGTALAQAFHLDDNIPIGMPLASPTGGRPTSSSTQGGWPFQARMCSPAAVVSSPVAPGYVMRQPQYQQQGSPPMVAPQSSRGLPMRLVTAQSMTQAATHYPEVQHHHQRSASYSMAMPRASQDLGASWRP